MVAGGFLFYAKNQRVKQIVTFNLLKKHSV